MEKPASFLDIPLPAIFGSILAISGLVFALRPVSSSRPGDLGNQEIGFAGDQLIRAKLWDDPLSAVAPDLADASKGMRGQRTIRRGVTQSFWNFTACKDRRERLQRFFHNTASSSIIVMPVFVQSEASADHIENRIRTRTAIIKALSQQKYYPTNKGRLGHLVEQRNAQCSCVCCLEDTEAIDTSRQNSYSLMSIPYETYACDQTANAPRTVLLLLWIPEAMFSDRPLARLSGLLERLDKPVNQAKSVIMIGPRSSDGLLALLQEITAPDRTIDRIGDIKNRLRILAATPTASDASLLSALPLGAIENVDNPTVSGVVYEKLKPAFFARTIITDDAVAQQLKVELKARDVNIETDPILIISEFDTNYGRALPRTFNPRQARNFTELHYMQGIDGDNSESTQRSKRDSTNSPADEYWQLPNGRQQLDYVQRAQMSFAQVSGVKSIKYKAIGVLGSDIYDKLMILHALRPAYPDAIFFSNNLDAQMFHPRELAATKNLIVGSPLGLTHSNNELPFRNSYETSIFSSVTLALGKLKDATRESMPDEAMSRLLGSPRLYEIGRNGPVDISVDGPASEPADTGSKSEPPLSGIRENVPQNTDPRMLVLCAFLVLLVIVSGMLAISYIKNVIALALALFVISSGILGVAWLQLNQRSEPLELLNGVSVWPTVALRLFAGFLAVAFIRHCLKSHAAAIADINSGFFPSAPGTSARTSAATIEKGTLEETHPAGAMFIFHFFAVVLKTVLKFIKDFFTKTPKQLMAMVHYTMRGAFRTPFPDRNSSRDLVNAAEPWRDYRLILKHRLLRAFLMAVAYLFAGMAVSKLFGSAITPARDPISWAASIGTLMFSVGAFLILMFLVIDNVFTACIFVYKLTGSPSDWDKASIQKVMGASFEDSASENAQPSSPRTAPWITKEDAVEYMDMRLVERVTSVVSPLAYYPFIILLIMLASRLDIFDAWNWPISLIIIFVVNALLCVGASLLLWKMASHARTFSLELLESNKLKLSLLHGGEKDTPAAAQLRQLDIYLNYIRNLDSGAFATLAKQPIIGAILVPSGGFGAWSIIQWMLSR